MTKGLAHKTIYRSCLRIQIIIVFYNEISADFEVF